MTTLHTEKAFEDAIEDHLLSHGYVKGDPAKFDRDRALFSEDVVAFVEATQGKVWAELRQHHRDNLERAFLDALCKALDASGTLNVIRHGLKFYGKTIRLAFFAPATTLNEDSRRLYEANVLTVTRQLVFLPDKKDSIDLVLSLNGLPIVTAELKNHLTGQTVEHAKRQYKFDRDAKAKIFEFKKRALVHFAVDPDLVFMTTRLTGGGTVFLPFNKGNGTGAGNPENPDGYRTAYLWEDVWQRDSLLDVLARFMHLSISEKVVNGKTVKRETMIFPRYHQLDAVRKLESHARAAGTGRNYLIQHSAGSGKSNSIAWLAHRLASLHDENDQKVFDSVVVITDRRVLDKQLQDTIYQFEHKSGVVERIDKDSNQLAEALKRGTPIIITTLQKFPFVSEKVGTLPKKRFAVIVDEAHSSQSGESAIQLKAVLSAASLEEAAKAEALEADHEEELLRTMLARGRQPNLSFFAFTATPKAKTLAVFDEPGPNGKPPFHLYSMRQAIEEEFILDVLKGYTTYKTFYRLNKKVERDPEVDKKKASKALARYMSLHPHNISQKVEVIIEHFRSHTRHKIGGKAKAMLVTASRLHAVRYKLEMDRYLTEKGYSDMKVLVAFSGTVKDGEIEYTEPQMNGGLAETELPSRFAEDDFKILIVAEKFQTGFDQPLLHTMYVDKRISGIQAVQTLSRLNRMREGKEDTLVLDFVNEPEDILDAFQPYYETASLSEMPDPQHLYELMAKLNERQIYFRSEVDGFARVFFKPKPDQSATDHARLNAFLDPSVNRFSLIDSEDEQEEFRKLLSTYVKLYQFMSQIISFTDADLEKLYTFGRFLLTKLPRREGEGPYAVGDEVLLRYYRLQKISEGSIDLQIGEGGELKPPTDVGTRQAEPEMVRLSTIIDKLNERFGTDFKPEDELFFAQVKAAALANEGLIQTGLANTMDNFALVFKKTLTDLFVEKMESNGKIVTRFFEDPAFKEAVEGYMVPAVYEAIQESNSTV